MIKNYLQSAIAAAFFVTSGISNVASAGSFGEPERPVVDLVLGTNGCVEVLACVQVTGEIGLVNMGGTPISDVDFYSFLGRKGDLVRIDIDDGMKRSTTLRSLDALIAIFKPDRTVLLQRNDVLQSEVDAGSISRFDPHMEVRLPDTGLYTVGVTSNARYPDNTLRFFLTGGVLTPFVATMVSNGRYTLVIERLEAGLLPISIDIKPGATSLAPFNPKSKGKIPVALLSHKDPNDPSKDFEAVKADRDSIRFGQTGTEAAGRCGKNGEDVNGDGLLDLVCHFEAQDAQFEEGEAQAIVTGTIGGMPFEGRGWLKIVPVKTKDD